MENGKTTEFITRETVINEGARVTNDPRVDSPEIKVIFPPQELIREPDGLDGGEQMQPTNYSKTDAPETSKEKEPHVCKVGIWQAVQQNWAVFTMAGIALIGIGYLIGKSR